MVTMRGPSPSSLGEGHGWRGDLGDRSAYAPAGVRRAEWLDSPSRNRRDPCQELLAATEADLTKIVAAATRQRQRLTTATTRHPPRPLSATGASLAGARWTRCGRCNPDRSTTLPWSPQGPPGDTGAPWRDRGQPADRCRRRCRAAQPQPSVGTAHLAAPHGGRVTAPTVLWWRCASGSPSGRITSRRSERACRCRHSGRRGSALRRGARSSGHSGPRTPWWASRRGHR